MSDRGVPPRPEAATTRQARQPADGESADRDTTDRETAEWDTAAHEPAVRPLDPGAVTLWRLGTAGRGAAMAGLVLGAELLLATPGPTGSLTAATVAIAILATALWPPLRYRAWGFALRDEHVYLSHGVLFRTTSLVPYARIQHVDTRHGPIDRRLGLASLVLFTAGTRGAIVTIPALEAGEAERVRDRLAAMSGAGDAV